MKDNTWDSIEDSGKVVEVLNSEEFKQSMQEAIKRETWDKDLPMVYMDKDRWLVKHYKDGTIEKIKKL